MTYVTGANCRVCSLLDIRQLSVAPHEVSRKLAVAALSFRFLKNHLRERGTSEMVGSAVRARSPLLHGFVRDPWPLKHELIGPGWWWLLPCSRQKQRQRFIRKLLIVPSVRVFFFVGCAEQQAEQVRSYFGGSGFALFLVG